MRNSGRKVVTMYVYFIRICANTEIDSLEREVPDCLRKPHNNIKNGDSVFWYLILTY